MHFLCFRPERLQTCQASHKVNNLTLSYSKLPCDQESPLLPSVTTFLPEQAKWPVERRYFPLSICWRGGDRGEVGDRGSPHSSLFCCRLVPRHLLHGDLWVLSLFYTCPHSPPTHWTFSPSYLSDSLGTFGLPDKRQCSTEAPSYLGSNYLWAASRPEMCAPQVLLIHLGCLKYNASPYTAFDSKKGRGKFLLEGSIICCLYIHIYIYICFKKSSNNKIPSKMPTGRELPGRKGQCLQRSSWRSGRPCSPDACVARGRASTTPGVQRKCILMGTTKQNKSHPKSTKQRFLLEERDRQSKPSWSVCLSLPTCNRFDLPFISIVTI